MRTSRLDYPFDGYKARAGRYMLSHVQRTGLGLAVPAQIYTDDGAKWATFDAGSWLATASAESIIDLAQHGWSSQREATDVARSGIAYNPDVEDLLAYLMFLRHGGLEVHCTCAVDRVSALEWLAYRRPDVYARVRTPPRVA